MKNIRFLLIVIIICAVYSNSFSQGYHVRIGTIGNSITHGVVLSKPLTQAFPIQLNDLLTVNFGDTCIVRNFGLTTTTMLKNGDVSYWDTQHFKDYLAYAPEICFIMLGTNDTKYYNWDVYGDEFIGDYLAMIDTIKQRNPSTRFLLAYPPPAYQVVWDIRDSIIVNGVIPAIDSIVKIVDAEIMDFYHPLLDSVHLFPDKIHPNLAGNKVMAKMLLERIIETDLIHKAETGLTFITDFKSNTANLSQGKSAELSWTSINAQSVFLDGQEVEEEGNIIVNPQEKTVYQLIAKGEKSNDTVELVQEVYIPELTQLRLSPASAVGDEGDTIFFKLILMRDQFNQSIENQTYDVIWNITENGSLFEETDTSVYFICDSPGITYLQVSYKDKLLFEARVNVKANTTGLEKSEINPAFSIYPNPSGDVLYINTNHFKKPFEIQLFDMAGRLKLKKSYPVSSHQGKFQLNLSNLGSGKYIINISSSEGVFSEKLIIENFD